MNKLRIALIDDDMLAREGLKAIVRKRAGMEVVGEAAADSRLAVELCRESQPAVCVVGLTTREGVFITEQIKKNHAGVRILAVAGDGEVNLARQTLRAGASGYFLKRNTPEELLYALHRVGSGDIYLDPSIAAHLINNHWDEDHSAPHTMLGAGPLSPREREVLRLLAWGYSNKEVGRHLNLSVKSIETYKMRLMDKLQLRSRVDIVRYALLQGWLQKCELPSEG